MDTDTKNEAPGKESQKLRKRLREKDAEISALSAQVEALQRQQIEDIIQRSPIKPAAVWAAAELADMVDETAYTHRSMGRGPEGISWLCAAYRAKNGSSPAMRWNRLHGERWIKPCRPTHPECATQTLFCCGWCGSSGTSIPPSTPANRL